MRWKSDPQGHRPTKTVTSSVTWVADQRLEPVVEVVTHALSERTPGEPVSPGVDRFEDAQIIGEMGGLAAKSGEGRLG